MKWERVKVSETCILARERGDQNRNTKRKSKLHSEGKQTPRMEGRARKESLPRKSRRKCKQVSGHKSSPGESAESWFHSKSGQT